MRMGRQVLCAAMVLGFTLLAGVLGADGPRVPLEERAVPAHLVTPMRAVDPLAVYSNVTTGLGFFYPGGSSAAGVTNVVADEVSFVTQPGVGRVNLVRCTVNNNNGSDVTARVLIRFWNADGVGGNLTTYYAPESTPVGYDVGPLTFTGLNGVILDVPVDFPVAGGTTVSLFVGIAFDNNGGTTGATDAELNSLGPLLYDPPDVGSSDNSFWKSTAPAAGAYLGVDTPPGGYLWFGGSPVANFGWELVVQNLPAELTSLSVE